MWAPWRAQAHQTQNEKGFFKMEEWKFLGIFGAYDGDFWACFKDNPSSIPAMARTITIGEAEQLADFVDELEGAR